MGIRRRGPPTPRRMTIRRARSRTNCRRSRPPPAPPRMMGSTPCSPGSTRRSPRPSARWQPVPQSRRRGRRGIPWSTMGLERGGAARRMARRARPNQRPAADARRRHRARRLGHDPAARAQALAGNLLAAALLRAREKARAHLPCLAIGLRAVPRERRRSGDPTVRLAARLDAVAAAAEAGLEDHDRWLTARDAAGAEVGRKEGEFQPAGADRIGAQPAAAVGGHDRPEARGDPARGAGLGRELGLREATVGGGIGRGNPVELRSTTFMVVKTSRWKSAGRPTTSTPSRGAGVGRGPGDDYHRPA